MIRQLLGTTHHSGVESRVASGLPIYELMEQIRLELRRSVGEEHALLFAEPNANADTGHIQWYAPMEGTARPMIELAADERRVAEARLAQLTTEIEAHTARLNQSRNPQDQHIAKVLDDALEIPREEDIFVVGGQPVIAAWGHVLRGPGAPRQILSALTERVRPPLPPPKLSVVEAPTAEGPTSRQADVDATERPASVAPLPTKNAGEEKKKRRRRFGWLFWLGLLLLALLLALVLALLLTRWKCYLYECPPEPPGVPSQPVPSQPAPPPQPPPSRDPADVRTPGEAPPVTKPPPGVMACSAATSSGGGQLTRNRHYVGKELGTVTIGYDMEDVPDELRVYYRGTIVATTERPVSGRGTLSFPYQPEAEFYTVVVEVVSASRSTTWKYTLGCPQ